MHQKIIQSLCITTFRRIPSLYRITSCSSVQTIRYSNTISRFGQMPSISEPEVKQSFKDLDPDTFGTLSKEPEHINEILDEMPEELEDKEEFDLTNEENKKQRRSPKYYHKLIQNLLKEKKIVEAIDVLENRMMKKDKVKPDYYTYNLLINGCAKVGYCEKAFKLYTRMRENRVKTTGATFTGLFNACAETAFKKDGLIRLNNLRKKLQDEQKELSIISYNALIKAYARLKDTQSAFLVVDEVLAKQYTLRPETFSFLFQACISDKENGMRHALLTWHKMRQKKIKPNLHIYNLFIRCIRDCNFGDEDDVKDAINRITGGALKTPTLLTEGTSPNQDLPEGTNDGNRKLESSTQVPETLKKSEFTYEEIEMVENRPNLLAKKPHLGTIISVKSVDTPTDRLLLLGGYKNLLKEMEADGVKPDIKTFSQLLSIVPSTEDSEKFILKEMKKYNVDINIEFCNILIKQRAFRCDYEAAKDVLSIIQANYLQPDLITFGVMAMSCRCPSEAIELIKDMKCFSLRLNAEIIGAMVQVACYRFNLDYVMFLMKLTKKYKIQPNQAYMDHLETLKKRTIETRRELKKKKPMISVNPMFRENSLVFLDYFEQWKKEVEVFKPPHPYRQFKRKEDAKNDHEENNRDSKNELSATNDDSDSNDDIAKRRKSNYGT